MIRLWWASVLSPGWENPHSWTMICLWVIHTQAPSDVGAEPLKTGICLNETGDCGDISIPCLVDGFSWDYSDVVGSAFRRRQGPQCKQRKNWKVTPRHLWASDTAWTRSGPLKSPSLWDYLQLRAERHWRTLRWCFQRTVNATVPRVTTHQMANNNCQ